MFLRQAIFSILGCIGICGLAPWAGAQGGQGFQYARYQEADGLQNEIVKGLAMDTLGFLWAATDGGLIRYDGLGFQQVLAGLPSNYVKSVLRHSGGGLLASTDMGVVEVVSKSDTAYARVLFQGQSQKSDTALWYPKLLYEDAQARVWFSDNHAVYRYAPEQGPASLRRYAMGDTCLPNHYHRSFSLFEDGYGHVFALAEPGYLFRWDEPADAFRPVALPQPREKVHYAALLAPGKVGVATVSGTWLLEFSPEGILLEQRAWQPVADVSYITPLPDGQFLLSCWSMPPMLAGLETPARPISQFPCRNASVALVQGGDCWVGTDNGLVLMQASLFQRVCAEQSPGYIQQWVQGMEPGVSYYSDGAAAYRLRQGPQGEWESSLLHRPQPGGAVIALLPTAEGIWTAEAPSHIRLVSENGQMLKSFDLSRFGGTVYMLAQDGRGNIWFCQDGLEGLGRITPQGTAEAVLANRGAPAGISVIKRLPDGELYFGGGGKSGFFFRYNPRMEVFENLSHAAPFEHHQDIAVFDFIPDGGGGFWLASSFGLLRWKPQGLERLPLGELTQDVVKALAKDDAGGLWLANSNGLMRVDLGTGERYVFDEKDGLPSKIVGYRNLRADGAGRLWVATISGLSVGVAQAPQPTPTPVFTGFSVNNEAAGAGRAAALLADDFMMARFVSPVHPSRFVRYEARIAGAADSAWVPLKQANAFTVGHLPNGQYVLEIRAKQRANFSWSQPVRFPFEVSTPWHRSWWGMGLAFVAALAVVRMAMFWNVRRLKWEKDKLEAVVESRTRELVEKHAEIEAQREELLQNQEELQTTLENLRLAQSQLVQAEKMSSIGQLTAGIAHEINNPINFVYAGSNTLEQLLRDMHQVLLAYERVERTADEPEAHAKALEKLAEVKDEMGYEELRDDILALLRDIRMGADRATEIVRNLRNFSRTDEGHFEQADVEMGIDSTLTLLSNKLKQGVKVEKKYCGLPLLRCMPAQLNQVFMNILSNAIDAIDPPGTITISTQDFADEVRVVISDTGKGMDAEVQRHIFEPFFTTKPIGEGTGLGMSVAYSIVEKHEGRIEIDSEVGKGTSFIISLPKNLGR